MSLAVWFALFWLLAVSAATPSIGAEPSGASSEELALGKRLFLAHCSRCHGAQGQGGFGPNLAQPKLRRAPDFEAMIQLINNGIPEAGMPGAWALWGEEVRPLALYARSLGTVASTPLKGDPARGKGIYENVGQCATCHRINKQGGTRGPDLTEIGLRRGPEHLRQSLLEPGAALPEDLSGVFGGSGFAQFLPVQVETGDGREIKGVRLNEDSFTIQLRDEEGQLHSLKKSGLKSLTKGFGQSLMPSYQSTLTPAQLDDLVAFLTGLRGGQ